MYCPRCAAQNLDDAKFCRGCGSNLETVVLALSGQYDAISLNNDASRLQLLQKRNESVRTLVKAISLLGSSLLIGTALGLLSNEPDWIIVWMIFAGWMAVWGVFSLVSGINGLIESRFVQRQIEQAPQSMLPRQERAAITAGLAEPPLAPRSSVTEHTTKHLTRPQ
jgi:hypothetical protein